MKKIFSFFAAILFAGSMMAEVGSLYYTFLPYKPSSGAVSDYTKTGTMTIEGMNWTVPGNWYGNGALRLGGKSIDGVDRFITAQDPMGSAISKIRIAHAGKTADAIVLNSITVTTASDADFTQDVTTKTVTDFTIAKNVKDTIDIVPATEPWATNSYYKFAFNFTNPNGSNYAVVVESIMFYAYTEGGGETPAHTYTVAGDNATLFGTTWAPTNEDNDMTLVEGLYKWEKTNQTLPAGNVAFKVCEDHAWTNCWPSDNYVLNIPEAGVYTITITYNPEGNVVNGVAQKTDDAVVIPTVAMHGNFLGSWADTENFAIAEGNETASLTLNLAAGDYEFGMRIGGSGNWTANGAAFTRENNSAVIVAGQGNITLDADAAGEYTFTWTYASNTLTITYPEFVPPTYTYADGYYLIGLDMQEWTMEYMPTEGRLFAANPDNEGEYQLTITLAADQQFKVVSVQKDQIKAWYPDGMDNNYVVDAAHAGEKTVYFRPDGQGGEGWHYGVIYVAANEDQPVEPTGTVIYNWSNVEAEQVGTTIIGAAGVTIENVKIHTNTDAVPGIKLGNSYNYADGKYIAIKPAEGGFKAGDKVNIAICFNNADDTKQAQVKAFAADGATELFLTAQGLNGRTAAGEPVVETFTLAADQDSILLGRYGNTATFITTLNVTRVAGDEPVVPTAAVTGDMTEWGEPIPFELSEDSTFATLYNDNIKKGTYAFKMIINGAWRSNGYEFHRGFPGCAGITGNTDANMTVVIDVEGAYTFKWYFANDSLAIIYPEKPEPVLTNGYYLVGKFSGVDAWDPVAANLFAANPDTEGEYQLSIDLAVDDEIKVVYVAEDVITTWYPKEGNYIVDDHHNGPTTMYFRPEYNSDWSAFGGYFYLVPTSTVGFENTAADAKAVKVLKNGILVIEKNNKTYNVMGQMVK